MQIFNKLWKIDFLQKLFDCTCTHLDSNEVNIFIIEFTIIDFVDDCALLEASKDALLVNIVSFKLIKLLGLLCSKLLKICTFNVSFLCIASIDCLLSNISLSFEIFEALLDFFIISLNDEVRCEVNNLFDILNGQVEQEAQCAWRTMHEPDMRNWRSKRNVTHALTARDTLSNQVAIFVDSGFARANTFKLRVVRIDILDWTEDTLTEETITFWFLRAIVNSFRLRNLAVAPIQDIFLTCNGKANRVEIVCADKIICPSHY